MSEFIRSLAFSPSLYAASVLGGLLLYVISTHLRRGHRRSAAAIAWVLAIVAVPYVAIPIFLLFGTRTLGRWPAVTAQGKPPATSVSLPAWAAATMAGLRIPPAVTNQAVDFHSDGAASLESLRHLIDSARHQLDLSSYILGRDSIGSSLCAQLARAARSGVRVRLLLDALGSFHIRSTDLNRLRKAGVQVRRFMPLWRWSLQGRANARNHRKCAIADQHILWAGGRNFAIEYFTSTRSRTAWIDLTYEVTGPLARQAQALFESTWEQANGIVSSPAPRLAGKSPDRRVEPLNDQDSAPSGRAQGSAPEDLSDARVQGNCRADLPAAEPHHTAQMVPSGPDQGEDTVYTLLLTALYRAEHRVVAVSPYFVPDDGLLDALCQTATRGVAVDLYLPARSNHPLADLARHRALRSLAQSGGRIHLHPLMMHAKAMIVDDAIALCGSVNLDGRSLFLNFESMAAFYDPADIAELMRWIDALAKPCQRYAAQPPTLLRDTAEGLLLLIAFQL